MGPAGQHGSWRYAAQYAGLAFVGNLLFPRVAYRLRWPTRLGPRGLLGYVALTTLLLFAIRVWVIPRLARLEEKRVRTVQALREQLGREPSDEELIAALMRER